MSERPDQRSLALARSLMALGGVLTVLEDAGNPAQVRNDFRAAYLGTKGTGVLDESSAYEREVADWFGVSGVPAARRVVRRATWRDYFHSADGQGLADRTQRRFFSSGSLPEDGVVDRGTTTKDIVDAAHRSQVYALPALTGLDLRELGVRRYVTVNDEPGQPPRRVLGYERVPGRVRYFLDGRVYGDAARALLPEIAGYAAGLIDHLFRGELRLSMVEGDTGRVQVKPVARRGRVRGGKLRVFAEDDKGLRHEIGSFDASGGAPDVVTVAVPAGARRLAAVLRGQDDAGEVVAFGELAIPVRR